MSLLLGTEKNSQKFPFSDLWYGIKINIKHGGKDTTDGKLERVGNLDLHRKLPIQSKIRRFMANVDGSVNYWLDQNDSTKKESGGEAYLNAVDGNVMLYKPPYWRKIEIQGNYMLIAISDIELPGFMYMKARARSPWLATFDRTENKAVSASFLQWDEQGEILRNPDTGLIEFAENAANFRGGTNDSTNDNKANSLLGVPVSNYTKDQYRTACKNVGDKWHFGGWRFREEISWLFAIEYGTLDSQATFNPNKTAEGFNQGGLDVDLQINEDIWVKFNSQKAIIPCGVTAKLGNNTGIIKYLIKGINNGNDISYKTQSYRGLEIPLLNIFEDCDDLNVLKLNKPYAVFYLCEDHKKFISPDGDNIPDGYKELGIISCYNGFISRIGYSNGWTFPNDINGGAANKYFCDWISPGNYTDKMWCKLVNCDLYHGGYYGGFWFTLFWQSQEDCFYPNGFPLCLELD